MRRLVVTAALVVPLAFAGSTATAASPGNFQTAARTLATATQAGTATAQQSVKIIEQGQQEASDLNDLLDRSAEQRKRVAALTGQVSRCESLSSASQDLQDLASDRQNLVDELGQMDLSDLPNSDTLTVDLEDALDASRDSDRNYADWADEAGDAGCPSGGPAPHTTAYRAAQFTDELATESKEEFVNLWNPIASTYGFPERSAREI